MAKGTYINGKWHTGDGDWFEKTSPATGETSWEGQAASAAQVNEAVEAAQDAGRDWRHVPQDTRTRILEAYAVEVEKRTDDISKAISEDMGKARWESVAEAGAMKGKIAVSIQAQVERAGGRSQDTAFGGAHLTHRPHGVMAVFGRSISPATCRTATSCQRCSQAIPASSSHQSSRLRLRRSWSTALRLRAFLKAFSTS